MSEYKNFSFIGLQIRMMFKSTSMSPCHLAHLKCQHEHIICITTLSIFIKFIVVHSYYYLFFVVVALVVVVVVVVVYFFPALSFL